MEKRRESGDNVDVVRTAEENVVVILCAGRVAGGSSLNGSATISGNGTAFVYVCPSSSSVHIASLPKYETSAA